jgi:phenylacetate-coenzyme A ligase PaaK-like adenylate-forming protein
MTLGYAVKNLADVRRAIGLAREDPARERWPRERIEALQRERLGELVEHASAHSRFYRAHYGGRIDRRDVRLEALPPVTKAMMMDGIDRFVTDPRLTHDVLERHLGAIGARDELLLGEYRVMASSGSSGRKGIYVYDRVGWSHVLAGAVRSSRMMDVRPRFPRRVRMAQVAAPDAKHMTTRGATSMQIGLFHTVFLSAAQPIATLVAALQRHRPEALYGYPSILALLAVEQLEGRLHIAPRVVCTSSEVRTAEMTARMKEAWNVDPFDGLGLTETGITAIDCAEHVGLHVFEDACIYEVVDADDRPVPPGRQGDKVLVTNLHNRTQPFIRFEVTDLVTVTDEPCPCGRTFRRITAIEGRSDDVLELSGTAGAVVRVHPIQLRSPLAAMAAVAQYQITASPDGLDVTLALVRDVTGDEVPRAVERTLGAKLAGLGVVPLPIRVRVVSEIAREPGAGKFKLIKAAPRAPGAPRTGASHAMAARGD